MCFLEDNQNFEKIPYQICLYYQLKKLGLVPFWFGTHELHKIFELSNQHYKKLNLALELIGFNVLKYS
jgi:hypothetical protein